ncbi:IDEAL domain-containing protein [Sutcliffiella sp. NC1]|uniref:IDEAL domain-containing protein n=1 Tax=Sutcliffiella sp. NC1 TaxID=3004096 RepID=UPI003FCEA982
MKRLVEGMSNNVKIGDWVKGNSEDGELIIGYVQALDQLERGALVKVVSSDYDGQVGKSIFLSSRQVKTLPEVNVNNKEQLLNLIDLALATGDKEWFMELSAKLNNMRDLAKNIGSSDGNSQTH